MQKITTISCANIAFIKYWGKRDTKLFLPTKSSLSITLPQLTTTTTISIHQNNHDLVTINDKQIDQTQITSFLDLFRKTYNKKDHFLISSQNNFPTAAGLASSASGFAALAKALNNLYNLNLSTKELSILARQGSGSACRSIEQGFVLWHKGIKDDGSDSYAEKLFPLDHWPELTVLVTIIDANKKKISSRIAMQETMQTSPFYQQWIEKSEDRISTMIKSIQHKDIVTLGALAEQDCLEMHQCIRTSNPPIEYWQPKTKEIIRIITKLRKESIPCYFTIDAGPNVKIITLRQHQNRIKEKLKNFVILSL